MEKEKINSRKIWLNWGIFGVLIFIRLFFFEHFMVPSASMTPTLNTGDILFVKKYSYSWNRMCLPFGGYLPFFREGYKLGSPKRGEPAVFIASRDPSTYYVKRIVALENDKVQMKNGILHINGKASKLEKFSDYTYVNDYGKKETGEKFKVTLPCGKEYFIYRKEKIGKGHIDNTLEFTVPKGHVWVQGDFHTNSADSFSPQFLGPVPIENLVGVPSLIIYGTNNRSDPASNIFFWLFQLPLRIPNALLSTNFSRIFTWVK